ncbi:hypothetical protein WA158_003420 [Blastocystis sp. Blastoise]
MDEMYPAKRIRYEEGEQPEPQGEYETKGKECTLFKLVVPYISEDKKGNRFRDSEFHPDYVHQIYDEDEILRGYKNPAVNITICATNLLCFYSFKHEGIDTANTKRKLMKKIFSTYLPEGSTNNKEDFIHQYESFDNKIVGEKRLEYNDKNNEKYIMTYSKLESQTEKDLFERFHKLSLFFVDSASAVKADPFVWSILFIYHIPSDSSRPPYIIGYTSIYTFTNPFHKPQQSIRICQMFVYPSYRKLGHGYRMMNETYKLAKELNNYIVTVESPCEDFVMLRDIYDIRRMKEQHILYKEEEGISNGWSGERTNEEYQQAASLLLCPVDQVKRVYDILRLYYIDTDNETEYKNYRISVKKRLGRFYREELSAIQDPEQVKTFFTEIYEDEEKVYKNVLKAAFKE